MKKNLVRRLIAMMAICAMLMVSAGMVFANAEDIEYITMFADGTVDVYEAANTDSQIVYQLEDADPVRVYELDASWYVTESSYYIQASSLRYDQYTEEPEEEPEVVEAPVVEEPVVVEAPVIEEPVVEDPVVEEPVAEEPVVEEPVAEEPVAEEPVVEEPVVEEPVVEEPVVEEPVVEEPVVEEPVVEEPVVEEPVVEGPVVEESVAEEPVAEEPVVEEPVVEEPVAEEPVAEEPVAEEPVAEEPVTEEPVVEEPVAEEPVAEEPVAEEETEEESVVEEAPETEDVTEGESEAREEVTEEETAVEEPETTEEGVEEIEEYETPLGLNKYEIITLTDPEQKPVSFREGADGMSPIIADLEKDAEIIVIGIEGDWVNVVVGEDRGYIYLKDILPYLISRTEENAEAERLAENETADPTANMKVNIFSSRRTIMEEGEQIDLTSKLEGFEDCEEIMYIWKVDKGNGFEVVEGANEDHYTFTATIESLTWDWHLTVLYR